MGICAGVGRLTTGDQGSWLLAAVIVAVTVPAIVAWVRRLDRRARREGEAIGVFACTSTPQMALLERVPQFHQPLSRVRLAFLSGGWLIGRLFVTEQGITWTPNTWTRRIHGAPELGLGWDEVARARLIDQPGFGDPGILELQLRNGADCAFAVVRKSALAPFLPERSSSDVD